MTLTCTKLSKSYGATHALRGVDLSADGGEIIALLGGNGAGKSTLIKILATLVRADMGKAELNGVDLIAKPQKARQQIGYLGHDSMLDSALTVQENLEFFGHLYGVENCKSRATQLLERFGAKKIADSPAAELSRGQEQAAALCRALMHNPFLILLDEPSTGLDVPARERLWQAAKDEAKRGAIVIFSTHRHEAAKATADRCIELASGKFVT
ncbi:MAG: heme ABC exporter ATP-binding protein CcmA [Planctomycetes bacterium]|nr:heme ABC exporter ATP-binding protein CcmA [Planctomycetota bacterium]